MKNPKLYVESAPGTPGPAGELVGFPWHYGSVIVPADLVPICSYSLVLPDGIEVAIGHTYPTSCTHDDKVFRYSAVCIAYNEPTRLATFEVRGEPA